MAKREVQAQAIYLDFGREKRCVGKLRVGAEAGLGSPAHFAVARGGVAVTMRRCELVEAQNPLVLRELKDSRLRLLAEPGHR